MNICAVCGNPDGVQWHHRFVEWAFSNAIDFEWIKGVAMGQITTIWSHTLQKEVPIPHMHLVYDLLRLTSQFKWSDFDPANPESFVDSPANMWPLCEEHHLAKDHGIHVMSFPLWVVQSCLKKDFKFSPDELGARHGGGK